MSIALDKLENVSRPYKRRKLLGRGVGCKKGKTCGRGHKGDKSRSGYKRRYGYEGGGVPLHRRTPTRGFSNAAFARKFDVINLEQINTLFSDGETVSLETLLAKGFVSGHSYGIKVLGKGDLNKKVTLQVEAISAGAAAKIGPVAKEKKAAAPKKEKSPKKK
jgi:large subunit ribosomal protein L15